jgi:hypothetical protein
MVVIKEARTGIRTTIEKSSSMSNFEEVRFANCLIKNLFKNISLPH